PQVESLQPYLDGLLGPFLEKADVHGGGEVFVASRIVLEQVGDGADAESLELFGIRRGVPGEGCDRRPGRKRQAKAPNPPSWRCRRRPGRRAPSGCRSPARWCPPGGRWRQGPPGVSASWSPSLPGRGRG